VKLPDKLTVIMINMGTTYDRYLCALFFEITLDNEY